MNLKNVFSIFPRYFLVENIIRRKIGLNFLGMGEPYHYATHESFALFYSKKKANTGF